MKILQLCPRVPFPPTDGGAIAMVSMREGLEANGCSVKVMCYNTSKHPVRIDELNPELLTKTGLTAVDIDNRVSPVDALIQLALNKSYHLSRFSSAAFRAKLEERLKQETFDAFILESVFLREAIPLIRKHSRAPVILRAHNVEYTIWKGLATTERNPIKKWYLKRLADQLEHEEKQLLAGVDGILAITPEDATLLQSLNISAPVQVAPAGMSMDKYSVNPDPDPLLVAHIGAMDWAPNVEGIQWFLKDVWPHVAVAKPEARLTLAGKNMPESIYKHKGPAVNIQGFVKNAGEFLYDAGIIIIPLLNGSGMRIKLLEALAMGKAIVTTPTGCEGIPVRDGEDVLIARTTDQFAEALIGLLSNLELQNRLRKSARELATKFDIVSIGLQTLRFVHKLKEIRSSV